MSLRLAGTWIVQVGANLDAESLFRVRFSLAKERTILSIISIIKRMKFARRYDLRIPEMTEMVLEFLKAKHLTGKLEHEFESGGSNPTGWVTLTVDTCDLKLHHELETFISNLERISAAAPHGIHAMIDR
jgi:hypothetical protein